MAVTSATTSPIAVSNLARPSRLPRFVKRLARLLYWPLVLALVALNAWWFWDDRPFPELNEVERWIAEEVDLDARSASWWNVWRVPHNNDGAIQVLSRMVRKSPHNGRARMLLGRAFGARKDYRSAAEQWHKVPFWSLLKPDAQYGEGLAWLELKRARDAENAMLAYLDVDPNHPSDRPQHGPVVQKLLDIYALEDRWDEARDLIWRAYDRSLGPVERLSLLQFSLKTRLERSNPAAALHNLRELAAADPLDWNARRALARAANAEKLYEEADREILACLKANPKDPGVWGDWVEMLRLREDFDGLTEALAKAPPEADADARVLMAKGNLRTQEKDHAAAADLYAKAEAINPIDGGVQYSLALALQLVGKVDEAEVHRRRHSQIEEMTKVVPTAVNAFKDATEAIPVKPADVKAAMMRLSEACEGMGWERDARGWARAAAETY